METPLCIVDERKYRKRVHRRGQVYLNQVKKKPKRVQPDDDHPTMKSALTGPYEPYVRAAIGREYQQYVETFESLHIFTAEEMHQLRTAGYDFKRALTSHMDIIVSEIRLPMRLSMPKHVYVCMAIRRISTILLISRVRLFDLLLSSCCSVS